MKVEVNKTQKIINLIFSSNEEKIYNEIVDLLYTELYPIDTSEEEYSQAFMLSVNETEISFLLLK